MKIENGTKWATDDLRYMIGQAFAAHGVPSKGVEVVVAVRRHRGFCSARAQGGTFKPNFERRAGASLVRKGVTLEHGRRLYISIRSPGASFSPTSDEHVGNVVELARLLDAEAVHMAGGQWSKGWHEKPIAWLSDWFEVHRGAKGQIAEARSSPLLPGCVHCGDPAAKKARKLERARAMLKKTLTRIRRAETSASKWRRKIAAFERRS